MATSFNNANAIHPFPEAYVSQTSRGVLSLHLKKTQNHDAATAAIQGSMRMANPNAIELEYVQQMNVWMLFQTPPHHIVQLGLGAASLTKFAYHQFPQAHITAIEINPHVIAACYEHFYLPQNDERLRVWEMDANDYLKMPQVHHTIDVLQVDLYDENAQEAQGPSLGGRAFYQACAHALTSEGMMTVNLYAQAKQVQQHIEAMHDFFDAVIWLPQVHDANVVVLAFKTAPSIDFSQLKERAIVIQQQTKMKALKWVEGLLEWTICDE